MYNYIHAVYGRNINPQQDVYSTDCLECLVEKVSSFELLYIYIYNGIMVREVNNPNSSCGCAVNCSN